MQARRANGGDEGAEDSRDDRDDDDLGSFHRVHAVGDGVEGVDLRVPDDDVEGAAQPGVQLVDVVDDEPREQEAQPAAEDADGQAVAEENARDAAAGGADALDDADVARLLDDDHVEDAEDEEDGDDADQAEEEHDQHFFVLDGVQPDALAFFPGLDDEAAGAAEGAFADLVLLDGFANV